jgi:hypothetical protein
MSPKLVELAVEIVRFVDDYQPGIVECEFNDADGHRHTLRDKVPIFTTELLDAHIKYPRPGTARCTALSVWQDLLGRELIALSTAVPFSIRSIDGLSEFVVMQSQVSAVTDPRR